MISELPFKSTIPELGKIIDGIEKAGEKILEVYETDFSTEKKMTIRQSLSQILKVIKF